MSSRSHSREICDDGRVCAADFEPELVPELLVSDLRASVDFWCGLCGFTIDYERPQEKFAYITRGGAHLMLEERGVGRNWIAADLDRPFGRGINLQISVHDLDPVLAALRNADWPLFMEPEVKSYRVNDRSERAVERSAETVAAGMLGHH